MAPRGSITSLTRAQLALLREYYPVVTVGEDGSLWFYASRSAASGAAPTVLSDEPQGAETKPNGHSTRVRRRTKLESEGGTVRRALDALTLLRDGQRHYAEDIAKALKLGGPRGLGSVSSAIRKALSVSSGIAEADVYQRMRQRSDGRRYWIARKRLKDAIADLERRAGEVLA
jgi:hypothetical protein